MNKNEFIEKLSSLEHDRWCSWQKYLHSCCVKNEDGSLTIPKILAERWEYEMNTKYKDLPYEIQESDRKEVYKMFSTINEYLQHQLEEDKVIEDILKKTEHVYNILNKYKENHIICFDKDLWGLYKRMDKELAEILERGKNGI